MLFCAEAGIDYEPVVVDLFEGTQFQPPYSTLNPCCIVPTLEDDDFVLTESSAILKYLADKYDSPMYPKDLRQRARVNEKMDWFNTQFYREYGYHVVYPQTLAHVKLEPVAAQNALVERGRENAARWLKVLDGHYLADGRSYLCGESFTIADCFGSGILTVGDWIGQTFSAYSNVDRWISKVKSRPSWSKVHGVHDQVAQSFQDGGDYLHVS
jgi:glutathione S-transferase